MNKPAPINNKNETANCRTSSPLLKRETGILVPRLCLRAVVKSSLVARQAGIDPKRRPVNNEITRVNTSTRQLILRSTPLGKSPVSSLVSATSILLPQKANSTPKTPPSAASNKLSVSNCRTSDQRPA